MLTVEPSLLDVNNETTPPEVIEPKPKAKSRAKAKPKSIAEPVAEPVVEPGALEFVNMKTRKPSNKQPKPVSQDPCY